jgi:YVTN family beta-propeller protein
MKTRLFLPIFLAAALLLNGQASSGTQGLTQQQLDDYIAQVQDVINQSYQSGGLQNGSAQWSVEVCTEGKIVFVQFQSFAIGGGVGLASNTIKTDQDCPPSTDENGNPLPYPNLLKTLQTNTVNPEAQPAHSFTAIAPHPEAAAASYPVGQLPLFRDVPFAPVYPSSAFPAQVPCKGANSPQVLLVNHGRDTVTIFNSCTGAQSAVIRVAELPLQAALTPDGTTALITSFNNAVSFINLATNKVTFTLSTPSAINPDGIDISPDGTLAYVTSFNDFQPSVQVINIAQQRIAGSVATANYPQSAFLTPDGAQLWVVCSLSNEVDVIDTLSLTVIRRLQLTNPFGVAFDPQGTRAFITQRLTPGKLVVLDTATFSTITTVTVANGAVEPAFAPDGSFLVVTGFDGHQISVVNPVDYSSFTGNLDGPPMGLAFVR